MSKRLAAVSLAFLALTACGQGAPTASAGGDRFAGLDQEILNWRAQIQQSHESCAGKSGDMACQDFQVACKGENAISPDEANRGVTAKIAAAMTFNGKGAGAEDLKPGSAFAEFVKTGRTWTRTEAKTLNLSTCAEI